MNEYLDQMLGTISQLDQKYATMQQQMYLQKTSKQQTQSALSQLKQGQTLVQSLTSGKNIGKPKADVLTDHYFGFPEDNLPQPFKAIYQIIQESVLKQVYLSIFDREKNKLDINFEGDIKEGIPSGKLDTDGITCLAHDQFNLQNYVLAGDKLGNVYLLDMENKIIEAKKEVAPGKRILHINCITRRILDCYVTTAAIITNFERNVFIYRYTSNQVEKQKQKQSESESKENFKKKIQLHHNYTVKLPAPEINGENAQEIDASSFPFESSFSQDGKLLSISKYSGDACIFAIPEPVIQPKIEPPSDEMLGFGMKNSPSNASFQSHNSSNSSLQNSQKSQQPQQPDPKNLMIQLDLPALPINASILSVETVFPKVPTTYEKEFSQYVQKQTQQKQDQQQQIQEAAATTSKAPFKKPDLKRPLGKPVEEPVVEKQVIVQKVDLQSNKKQVFINGTETLLSPKFCSKIFFLPFNETISNKNKQFNKPDTQLIITDLVEVFLFTKIFRIVTCKTTLANQLEFTLKNEYQLIYDICQVETSKNGVFMAFGLVQGTIIVWDMLLLQEKFYLDKHLLAVSAMRFLGDIILISGAFDGTVHVYDLQNEGKPIMKRTNLFRQKNYHITNITVSEAGVACVLDSKNNLRMYDLFHGEKLLRMIPCHKEDEMQKTWKFRPYAIILGSKEIEKKEIPITQESESPYQSGVSVPKNPSIQPSSAKKSEPDEITESPWDKSTQLLIFRTFDNLINLFPGLSNLYRKGIDIQRVLNAFQKLEIKDLMNPTFEIKNLVPEVLFVLLSCAFSNSLLICKALKLQKNNLRDKQHQNVKIILKIDNLIESSIGSQSQTEFSSTVDFNSSFQSSIQYKKPIVISKGQGNVLTKEVLHPEKQLSEKQDYNIPKVIDENKLTIENVRNRNAQKNQRQDRMNNIMTKIGQELQFQDDKQRLEKQKQLLDSKAPHFENSKKK